MKIVTPAEMKAIDLRTVEEGLFTSLRLMQNAADALYREITLWAESHGETRILLLAGPGNNGGDAYALALLLADRFEVALLPVGGEDRSPDCAYYYARCVKQGIPFVSSAAGYPLVVDGVFGTGFRGALPAEIQSLFETVRVPVAAIDIPSGMDGNSGVTSAGTLRPELTVTFAFLKPCHLFADCGRVVLADIGIPRSYAAEISRSALTPCLSPRSAWGHKNSYGAAGLRVGADCYQGAAALALKGALFGGAGLVFGYLPASIRPAVAAKLYGPVLKEAEELFPLQCDAYLYGSGLGRDLSAAPLAQLWQSDRPLVVDGDGLWYLKDILQKRTAPTVLTPHMGEFARLCGVTVGELAADRLNLASQFAAEYGVVLVLKDAATLVTDGTRTEILSAPCSALAKGGSGDLLAGLTVSLLATGQEAYAAAKTAVYLHNRAAHLACQSNSARFLQPERIADYINDAWMELEHGLL